MPDVRIDSDSDGVRTEESVVKVSVYSLGAETPATWYLAPGESFEIGDDGPSHVEVEVLDDADE